MEKSRGNRSRWSVFGGVWTLLATLIFTGPLSLWFRRRWRRRGKFAGLPGQEAPPTILLAPDGEKTEDHVSRARGAGAGNARVRASCHQRYSWSRKREDPFVVLPSRVL